MNLFFSKKSQKNIKKNIKKISSIKESIKSKYGTKYSHQNYQLEHVLVSTDIKINDRAHRKKKFQKK